MHRTNLILSFRSITTVCGIFLAIGLSPAARAQSRQIPVKLGLWESQVSSTMVMALPPEAEARIAAMPPDRQAQMRGMMSGSKPNVSTYKSCVAQHATMDELLDQNQNKSGMKCTFTNRTQTSDGASFDTSCTMPQGTATGHTEFHMLNDEHWTSTTHISADMSGKGGATRHVSMESTVTSRYVGAQCGDVKPSSPTSD